MKRFGVLLLFLAGGDSPGRAEPVTLWLKDKGASAFSLSNVSLQGEKLLLSGGYSTSKRQPVDSEPWIAKCGPDFQPEWCLGWDHHLLSERVLAFLGHDGERLIGNVMLPDAAWVTSFAPPAPEATRSLRFSLLSPGKGPGAPQTARWMVGSPEQVMMPGWVEDTQGGIRLVALNADLEPEFDHLYRVSHFFRSSTDPRLGGRASAYHLKDSDTRLIFTAESDLPFASTKLQSVSRHRLGLLHIGKGGDVNWSACFETSVSGITFFRAFPLEDGGVLGLLTFDFQGFAPARTLVLSVSGKGKLRWARALDLGNVQPIGVTLLVDAPQGDEMLMVGLRMSGGKLRSSLIALDPKSGDLLRAVEPEMDFAAVAFATLGPNGWLVPSLSMGLPAGKPRLELLHLSPAFEFLHSLAIEKAAPIFPGLFRGKDGTPFLFASFPPQQQVKITRLTEHFMPQQPIPWLKPSKTGVRNVVVKSLPYEVTEVPMEVSVEDVVTEIHPGPQASLLPLSFEIQYP